MEKLSSRDLVMDPLITTREESKPRHWRWVIVVQTLIKKPISKENQEKQPNSGSRATRSRA
jgi:hypothetical protein